MKLSVTFQGKLVFFLCSLYSVKSFLAPQVTVSQSKALFSTLTGAEKGEVTSTDSKSTLKLGDKEATVFAYGAVLTSYNDGKFDCVGVRKDAVFDESKPIAAGTQICWPQFGPGEIQQHGFARNMKWNLESESTTSDGYPTVTLELNSNEETKAMWNYNFKCLKTFTLTPTKLISKFEVINKDEKDFEFTSALHSYYSCDDVEKIEIKGPFKNQVYVDKTKDPFVENKGDSDTIMINKFMEGVFPDMKGEVSIDDKVRKTITTIKNTKGWNDYILWAPLGNDAYEASKFVCIESGCVSKAVKVKAGESWCGEFEIVPKSY